MGGISQHVLESLGGGTGVVDGASSRASMGVPFHHLSVNQSPIS